jgi:hypothetical protein
MKQEILNRLNAAYDATQNCCIAITLSNYIDTVEGISEEEFDREVYDWYDKALTDFGYPKEDESNEQTYVVVKVDKITGIVLAEQVCPNYESANEFIKQVAKLGYEPSQTSGFMYETSKFGLTIK